MKKLLLLVVLSLFVTGIVWGATAGTLQDYPDYSNVIFSPHGGTGVLPPVWIVKVRYGRQGNADDTPFGVAGSLTSGDVVCWDETSNDGYTISGCVITNALSYCGVLVTSIATPDTSAVDGGGPEVGWMAIRGYCLANIDTDYAATGQRLVPVGGSGRPASFGTSPAAADVTLSDILSNDIGYLIEDTGTSGVMPVWLD